MNEEKKRIIQEFGKTFSELPEKEQYFLLGRIEGFKAGYEEANKK